MREYYLLKQHELRQKGSRYFPPERTQPFIITFLQALVSFKRLARKLKQAVTIARNSYSQRGEGYLFKEIRKIDSIRYKASFGGEVMTMTNLKPPPIPERIEYRCAYTGKLYRDEVEAHAAEKAVMRPQIKAAFKTKRQKMKKQLKRLVSEHIARSNLEYVVGVTVAKKLERKLRINSPFIHLVGKKNQLKHQHSSHNLLPAPGVHEGGGANSPTALHANPAAASGAAGGAVAATIAAASAAAGALTLAEKENEVQHLLRKNAMLTMQGLEQEADEKAIASAVLQSQNHEIVDYSQGTSLYYGSSIALQAKHGGYLSFFDGDNVRASAHKILLNSRYVILMSKDLTFTGVVSYGDAVWLQAGQFEVLGAAFSGSVTGSGRKIRPTLINSRRENMNKAKQYGRWIILNRDDPVETIGMPVCHQDKILLEQEWYFLASSNPTDSYMNQTKADVDKIMDGSCKTDLLRPNEECSWRIHLVAVASTGKSEENKRAILAQKAMEQIEKSTLGRKAHRKILFAPLEGQDPELLKDGPLSHKQSEFLNQKNFMNIYGTLSAKGFTRAPSIEFLKKLYGRDSFIYRSAEKVQRIKDKEIGIEERPLRVVRVHSKNAVAHQEEVYWDSAQSLLVPSNAYENLENAMSDFYRIDFENKVHTAMVLKRFFKMVYTKTFKFERKMIETDRTIAIKWHKILEKRHALLLGPSSSTKGTGSENKYTPNSSRSSVVHNARQARHTVFAPMQTVTTTASSTRTVSTSLGVLMEASPHVHATASPVNKKPASRGSFSAAGHTTVGSAALPSSLSPSPQRNRGSRSSFTGDLLNFASFTSIANANSHDAMEEVNGGGGGGGGEVEVEAVPPPQTMGIVGRFGKRAQSAAVTSSSRPRDLLSQSNPDLFSSSLLAATRPPIHSDRERPVSAAQLQQSAFVPELDEDAELDEHVHRHQQHHQHHLDNNLLPRMHGGGSSPTKINARLSTSTKKEIISRAASARLGVSKSMPNGLPKDVFEDVQHPIGISHGVRFLRTLANPSLHSINSKSNNAIYADLLARHKSGGGGEGSNSRKRPETASALRSKPSHNRPRSDSNPYI